MKKLNTPKSTQKCLPVRLHPFALTKILHGKAKNDSDSQVLAS